MNPGYILVVDDEPDIRRLMQEILEDEHYKVMAAEDAAAARAAVKKQRPDLVLLDIWMPGTDGISLLREWAHAGPLETDKLRRENLRLRRQAEPAATLTGKSPAMQQLRENLERIAATDAGVLITGEGGSGKDVAARYLHSHSPRKDRPFVEVSLTAITPAHAAAQLFGQENKGAVTPRCFEQAGGGTL